MTFIRRPKNKFNSKKIIIDEMVFDSLKEGKRYQHLKFMQTIGQISDLRMQVPYLLKVNGILVCKYLADFVYIDLASGLTITEDVKGFKTAVYKLKKKLMKAIHGIEILET